MRRPPPIARRARPGAAHRSRRDDAHIQTLFVLMLVNAFALALSLPAIMGWHVSRAARFAQGSVVAQGLGWACFLAARPFGDRLFSTLWIGCIALSFALMWHAMRHWVGPRRGATWCSPSRC